VEVESFDPAPRTFNTWVPALVGDCVLIDSKLNAIPPLALPSGVTLDPPQPDKMLLSIRSPITQALVFELPTGKETLTLILAGSHVQEEGHYAEEVRPVVWLPKLSP
jgi:hypothetical protein